jgi:hypothetical protein
MENYRKGGNHTRETALVKSNSIEYFIGMAMRYSKAEMEYAIMKEAKSIVENVSNNQQEFVYKIIVLFHQAEEPNIADISFMFGVSVNELKAGEIVVSKIKFDYANLGKEDEEDTILVGELPQKNYGQELEKWHMDFISHVNDKHLYRTVKAEKYQRYIE